MEGRNEKVDFTGLFMDDAYYDEHEPKKYISLREIEMNLVSGRVFGKDQLINLRDTFPDERLLKSLFENDFYVIPVPKITSRDKLLELYQKETNNSLGEVRRENHKDLFNTNVDPGWYAVRIKRLPPSESKELGTGKEQDLKRSSIRSNASLEFMLWFSLFRRDFLPVETETEVNGVPMVIYTNDRQRRNEMTTHVEPREGLGIIAELVGPFPKGLDKLDFAKIDKNKLIEY